MDCTKVGVFQEANQIVLCSFLQSQDHTHLEAQIVFTNIFGNFADQVQKGVLAYEELSALLEPADITEGYYPWPVSWSLLSGTAFRNSLGGSLPPTVGWSFLWDGSSPAEIDGPASAAICMSCPVGG